MEGTGRPWLRNHPTAIAALVEAIHVSSALRPGQRALCGIGPLVNASLTSELVSPSLCTPGG
jgi:hypothetical protein